MHFGYHIGYEHEQSRVIEYFVLEASPYFGHMQGLWLARLPHIWPPATR
jgi:hypothetical protein